MKNIRAKHNSKLAAFGQDTQTGLNKREYIATQILAGLSASEMDQPDRVICALAIDLTDTLLEMLDETSNL